MALRGSRHHNGVKCNGINNSISLSGVSEQIVSSTSSDDEDLFVALEEYASQCFNFTDTFADTADEVLSYLIWPEDRSRISESRKVTSQSFETTIMSNRKDERENSRRIKHLPSRRTTRTLN